MLGIDLTPLLASATIIGATLGFGAQPIVRDYLSGFLLTVEDQFGVGDSIVVGTMTGTVEDVSLRVTRVRAPTARSSISPTATSASSPTVAGWAHAVVDVPIGAVRRPRPLHDVVTEAANKVATSPGGGRACTEPPDVVGFVATDEITSAHPAPRAVATNPATAPPWSDAGGVGELALAGRCRTADPAGGRMSFPPRITASPPPHGLDRRRVAGPQRELRRRLVDEHAEPLNGPRPRRRRPPSTRSVGGRRRGLLRPAPRLERHQPRGRSLRRRTRHAERRGVHHQVADPTASARALSPGGTTAPARPATRRRRRPVGVSG